MEWYREVWSIINRKKTSTGRSRDGVRTVKQPRTFKGLAISDHVEINSIIEDHQKQQVRATLGNYDNLDDIKRKSANTVPTIINSYFSKRDSIQVIARRVIDSSGVPRNVSPDGSGLGGTGNNQTNSGVWGQDSSMANFVTPNIWLSPAEATAIYSQKGIEETIFKKKSKSIILNGVRIKNPYLTPVQQEAIDRALIQLGVAELLSDGVLQSLVQGGALIYPMFKHDTPLSMGMPMSMLHKYGILGKGCISRFNVLDRWNVVHVPTWNPTAEDYKRPKFYYIPFQGCDVNGERCSRVVTAEQPTYWGTLMTLGWGIADSLGWIEAVLNYKNVLRSVPNMINQMSVVIRKINMEASLATESSAMMEEFDFDNTVRTRQASINNPISMDVIGDVEAIKRDFQQVPELVRLVRQDAAAKANVPEELIWSSERGAFASGDTTDSAFEKQSEGTRYIHVDVAAQCKTTAQIIVIHALGLDREVLKILDYTTFEFDNPKVTNAKDKAEIGGKMAKGFFDLVAGGAPVDAAMDITQQLSDEEFHVNANVMDQLRARQAQKDEREQEKHDKEMALMDAQIEQTKAGAKQGFLGLGGTKKPKSGDDKKGGHSYKDPLEQKKHETVGGKGKQGLQKAAGKEKT